MEHDVQHPEPTQCYTQGCQRTGRILQVTLSSVPKTIQDGRYPACTIYLCVPCQEAFFHAAYAGPNTRFEVAIPAAI